MSTVNRRRGKSLHLNLPNGGTEDDGPAIAALFLVQFDQRKGYTIAWQRTISRLELSDSVEYKSLPSGLHNVREDFVYFVHTEYAGISAFVNEPASDSQRNAEMIAVGALIPLSHGRLGRSWKHAEELKVLARRLVEDVPNKEPLESFWEAHCLHGEKADQRGEQLPQSSSPPQDAPPVQAPSTPEGQPKRRSRAISTASALASPGQALSSHHPALSLPEMLNTFGPLVYPLYKAALLRKRILLVSQAPVELACNFVYDFSVLSNIPSSVADTLPLEPLPLRLQPLFSVGVHDIDMLKTGSRRKDKASNDDDLGYGWVSCTTDDVLATKPILYDILVILPPPYSKNAKEKVWPKTSDSQGSEIKANQRDLRRYHTLRRGLHKYGPNANKSRSTSPFTPHTTGTAHDNDGNNESFPSMPSVENTQETFDDASSTSDEKLIESSTWSSLAYSSFMWWASAGEKSGESQDEVDLDAGLLPVRPPFTGLSPRPSRSTTSRRLSPSPGQGDQDSEDSIIPEMAIIAYFHRFTTLILGTLAEIIEIGDKDEPRVTGEQMHQQEEDQEHTSSSPRPNHINNAAGGPLDPVEIGSEDMIRMGLDVWSESDRNFVEELVSFYWGRRADVQGGTVECCGLRVC